MLLLAQFASPPDVYNLCLTNKDRFFRSAGNTAAVVVVAASSKTASDNETAASWRKRSVPMPSFVQKSSATLSCPVSVTFSVIARQDSRWIKFSFRKCLFGSVLVTGSNNGTVQSWRTLEQKVTLTSFLYCHQCCTCGSFLAHQGDTYVSSFKDFAITALA